MIKYILFVIVVLLTSCADELHFDSCTGVCRSTYLQFLDDSLNKGNMADYKQCVHKCEEKYFGKDWSKE